MKLRLKLFLAIVEVGIGTVAGIATIENIINDGTIAMSILGAFLAFAGLSFAIRTIFTLESDKDEDGGSVCTFGADEEA
jgi:hypothetical protein